MKQYLIFLTFILLLSTCTDSRGFQPSNPTPLDKVEEQMQELKQSTSKLDHLSHKEASLLPAATIQIKKQKL